MEVVEGSASYGGCDYDATIAAQYDSLHKDPKSLQEDLAIAGFLREYVAPGCKVLDLGCGTGLLLELLALQPEDYLGIDHSEKMLEELQSKFPEHETKKKAFGAEDLEDVDVAVSLFGPISYVDPDLVFQLVSSGVSYFLMFYKEDYRPVTYDTCQVHPYPFQRKFNTRSDGRTIAVTTRYQNFDTWNWQERAAEIELYSLSKRLSVVFTTFEALPVLGAMLFRTGYTGLQSRWPLIISFLLAFSLDFTRQQVPFLEKQLCLLQVQAIQREESLIKLSWQGDDVQGVCKLQLAAIMAITLLMMLPCIFGIAEVKVRSSVFSCWLGVAFMLLIQLMFALQRTESSEKVDDAAEAASDNEEGSDDKAADKAAADT